MLENHNYDVDFSENLCFQMSWRCGSNLATEACLTEMSLTLPLLSYAHSEPVPGAVIQCQAELCTGPYRYSNNWDIMVSHFSISATRFSSSCPCVGYVFLAESDIVFNLFHGLENLINILKLFFRLLKFHVTSGWR